MDGGSFYKWIYSPSDGLTLWATEGADGPPHHEAIGQGTIHGWAEVSRGETDKGKGEVAHITYDGDEALAHDVLEKVKTELKQAHPEAEITHDSTGNRRVGMAEWSRPERQRMATLMPLIQNLYNVLYADVVQKPEFQSAYDEQGEWRGYGDYDAQKGQYDAYQQQINQAMTDLYEYLYVEGNDLAARWSEGTLRWNGFDGNFYRMAEMFNRLHHFVWMGDREQALASAQKLMDVANEEVEREKYYETEPNQDPTPDYETFGWNPQRPEDVDTEGDGTIKDRANGLVDLLNTMNTPEFMEPKARNLRDYFVNKLPPSKARPHTDQHNDHSVPWDEWQADPWSNWESMPDFPWGWRSSSYMGDEVRPGSPEFEAIAAIVWPLVQQGANLRSIWSTVGKAGYELSLNELWEIVNALKQGGGQTSFDVQATYYEPQYPWIADTDGHTYLGGPGETHELLAERHSIPKWRRQHEGVVFKGEVVHSTPMPPQSVLQAVEGQWAKDHKKDHETRKERGQFSAATKLIPGLEVEVQSYDGFQHNGRRGEVVSVDERKGTALVVLHGDLGGTEFRINSLRTVVPDAPPWTQIPTEDTPGQIDTMLRNAAVPDPIYFAAKEALDIALDDPELQRADFASLQEYVADEVWKHGVEYEQASSIAHDVVSQYFAQRGLDPMMGKTAAMSRKKRLEMATRLPNDKSTIVHDFGNGWTVRQLQTKGDRHREGHLMSNCWRFEPDEIPVDNLTSFMQEPLGPWFSGEMRDATNNDPNGALWMSLRDHENLPHASFYQGSPWSPNQLMQILGTHNSSPKDEYVQMLRQYARENGLDFPGFIATSEWHTEPKRTKPSEWEAFPDEREICPHCGAKMTSRDYCKECKKVVASAGEYRIEDVEPGGTFRNYLGHPEAADDERYAANVMHGDQIAGSVQWGGRHHLYDPNANSVIYHVWTHPDHAGKGLMSMMRDYIEDDGAQPPYDGDFADEGLKDWWNRKTTKTAASQVMYNVSPGDDMTIVWAELDGVPVGHLSLGHDGEVIEVEVNQAYQRQGIATGMVQAAEAHGIKVIHNQVHPSAQGWVDSLDKTSAAQVMYHVAPTAYRESIQQQGLTGGGGPRAGVYVTTNPQAWSSIFGEDGYNGAQSSDEFDVWQVDVTGLQLHPDDDGDPGEDFITEMIPPDKIKLLRTVRSGWNDDWQGFNEGTTAKTAADQTTMYHVVPTEHVPAKLAEGLRDEGTGHGVWEPGVYLWGDPEQAERYRQYVQSEYGKPHSILHVDTTGLPLRPDPWFAEDGEADDEERAKWNDAHITESVPPERIQKVTHDKTSYVKLDEKCENCHAELDGDGDCNSCGMSQYDPGGRHYMAAYEFDPERLAIDAQTMSQRELAAKYNVSQATIYRALQRHNIEAQLPFGPPKARPMLDRETILAQLESGVTMAELSRQYGVSRQAIWAVVNQPPKDYRAKTAENTPSARGVEDNWTTTDMHTHTFPEMKNAPMPAMDHPRQLGFDTSKTYWGYLNGDVAFGPTLHGAVHKVCIDKLDETTTRRLTNLMAAGAYPQGMPFDIAAGVLVGGRPRIMATNLDRNAVYDAVFRKANERRSAWGDDRTPTSQCAWCGEDATWEHAWPYTTLQGKAITVRDRACDQHREQLASAREAAGGAGTIEPYGKDDQMRMGAWGKPPDQPPAMRWRPCDWCENPAVSMLRSEYVNSWGSRDSHLTLACREHEPYIQQEQQQFGGGIEPYAPPGGQTEMLFPTSSLSADLFEFPKRLRAWAAANLPT